MRKQKRENEVREESKYFCLVVFNNEITRQKYKTNKMTHFVEFL